MITQSFMFSSALIRQTISKRPRLAFERPLYLEANWFVTTLQIKDIYVPHALENSLMMFDSQNYERLFPREQRLFSRPFWPYSLHTFSLVSLVKKYATCKAKIALKKAFVHLETDVHSFSCPIINFFYNECGKDTFYQF